MDGWMNDEWWQTPQQITNARVRFFILTRWLLHYILSPFLFVFDAAALRYLYAAAAAAAAAERMKGRRRYIGTDKNEQCDNNSRVARRFATWRWWKEKRKDPNGCAWILKASILLSVHRLILQ
jgi:hypothetical protein